MPTSLTTDDRLAIGELLARYARAIDFRRWDELPTFFTPDCVVDFGRVMGVHEGHDGVRRMAEMIDGTGLTMRHYVTNVIVERADGERADVTSYVLALTGPAFGSLAQTTGRYDDELVKRDGRWLIQRRRAVIEMPGIA
jgi:3-phenylpropionate/cinnamic acid dioxygenase small subunit